MTAYLAISFVLVIFLLLVTSPQSLALSWPSSSKAKHRRNSALDQKVNIDVIELARGLLDELDNSAGSPALRFNLDALKGYSHKPDCFKRVANKILGRCEELDVDDERVDAAISMTLCEVATGMHYSIPSECTAYFKGGEDLHQKRDLALTDAKTRGRCVDSLARSPQFWSSYSGHLREIPQLCYAFRRWNDIDLARNIYYNITVEKISLVSFILDRERKSERHLQDLILQSEAMHNAVHEITTHSEKYRITIDHLTAQLHSELNGTLDLFTSSLLNAVARRDEAEAVSLAKLDTSLDDLMTEHVVRLNEIVGTLHDATASKLDSLLVHHRDYYEQLGRDFVLLQNGWNNLGQSLYVMNGDIDHLSKRAHETSDVIASALTDAYGVRNIQAETTESAHELVRMVVQLTETAQREISKINGSAYEVQRLYLVQQESKDWPWRNVVFSILALFNQKRVPLVAIENLAWFKFLITALGFGWTIFRMIVSLVISGVLLFPLMTRRLFAHRPVRRDFFSNTTTWSRPHIAFPSTFRPKYSSWNSSVGRGNPNYVSRIPDRLSPRSN